jgi:acyl-CoA thioester hydrolase
MDMSVSAPYTLARIVADEDIDMLGHASNIAVVRWIQDVAVSHSEAVGLGFDAYARLGAVFVIRRNEIDYLRPMMHKDELVLRTWISGVAAAKCQRTTEICRGETVCVRSLTTWGFVDGRTGRPTRITDEVRAAFGYSPRERGAVVAPPVNQT